MIMRVRCDDQQCL